MPVGQTPLAGLAGEATFVEVGALYTCSTVKRIEMMVMGCILVCFVETSVGSQSIVNNIDQVTVMGPLKSLEAKTDRNNQPKNAATEELTKENKEIRQRK